MMPTTASQLAEWLCVRIAATDLLKQRTRRELTSAFREKMANISATFDKFESTIRLLSGGYPPSLEQLGGSHTRFERAFKEATESVGAGNIAMRPEDLASLLYGVLQRLAERFGEEVESAFANQVDVGVVGRFSRVVTPDAERIGVVTHFSHSDEDRLARTNPGDLLDLDATESVNATVFQRTSSFFYVDSERPGVKGLLLAKRNRGLLRSLPARSLLRTVTGERISQETTTIEGDGEKKESIDFDGTRIELIVLADFVLVTTMHTPSTNRFLTTRGLPSARRMLRVICCLAVLFYFGRDLVRSSSETQVKDAPSSADAEQAESTQPDNHSSVVLDEPAPARQTLRDSFRDEILERIHANQEAEGRGNND